MRSMRMSPSPPAVHYVILLVWSVWTPSFYRTFRMASGDEESRLYPSGESSNNSSMFVSTQETEHGYDYHFVSQVESAYKCPICLFVLRDPVQTECGHRFCKGCLTRWQQQQQAKCPACQELLDKQAVFRDKFAQRFINNFKVRCINQGCSEEPELGKLKDHLDSCVFVKVPCPGKCGKLLNRLDVERHLNSECENRSIKCEMCGNEILSIEEQHHKTSLCPQLLTSCQYCQKQMKKHELMKHCEEDCEKIPISCKYQSLGCTSKPTRESMEDHRKSSVDDHMDLLLDELKSLTNEFQLFREKDTMSKRALLDETSALTSSLTNDPMSALSKPQSTFSNPYLNAQLQRLLLAKEQSFYSDPSALTHHLERQFADLSLNRGENVSRGPDTSALKSELLRMSGSLAEKTMALEDSTARMGKLENKLEEQSRLIRELSTKMTEMESRFSHGCYLWKVTNFRKLREEAKTGSSTVLHSPGFYSSLYGYRLCIRLNLNGVDSATGHHLSLFVHFMKGEYDDILPWPFRGRITLSILDQNIYHEERQHLSEVLIAKPRLAAFQKPVTQRNHKGFGYMEYAPLVLIDRQDSTYVQNDSLFIRAMVEHEVDLVHERPF